MINKAVMLSIIIPTLGRKTEFEALLKSIEKSDIPINYEIIVVDQNPTRFLDDICNAYSTKMPLMQYKVGFKGASRARNFGVQKASGNIVCFPDDDAEFLPDTIKMALSVMEESKAECIFGRVINKDTGEDVVIRFQKEEKYLSLTDFEGAFVEATMFAKTALLRKFPYDEELGVGTIHGAEEGYDLVYRLLCKKKSIYYSPKIVFYHPPKILNRDTNNEVKRAFYYSCGYGYLCKKHRLTKKYVKRLIKLIIISFFVVIIKRKWFRYFQAQILGLISGYRII